jgi:hypothetical protein
MWIFVRDAYVSQGAVEVPTLVCRDSSDTNGDLPWFRRTVLFRELMKEELDCELRDIFLDVAVQGVEAGHLGILIK